MSSESKFIPRRDFVRTACAACAVSWMFLNSGCGGKDKPDETQPGVAANPEKEAQLELVGICGIVCSDCEAYIATQKDDYEEKVRVAKKWREMYEAEFTPESITCDGCPNEGRLSSYALDICNLRKCARSRKVKNCAYCEEYPCADLNAFFELAPNAKVKLEEIRRSI